MIDLLLVQNIGLILSSLALAEIFDRSKIKAVITLQRNIQKTKNNLLKVTENMGQKGASGVIFNFGSRILNFHHSRFGWFLTALSVAFANLSLFFFSVGLILHHALKEKKIF